MNNTAENLRYDDKQDPPDIFRAAENNDVSELSRALDEGQSLRSFRGILKMTPIHVACLSSSGDFLAAATHHKSFDPWIRDGNLRLALDHAAARNNRRMQKALLAAMYPEATL